MYLLQPQQREVLSEEAGSSRHDMRGGGGQQGLLLRTPPHAAPIEELLLLGENPTHLINTKTHLHKSRAQAGGARKADTRVQDVQGVQRMHFPEDSAFAPG